VVWGQVQLVHLAMQQQGELAGTAGGGCWTCLHSASLALLLAGQAAQIMLQQQVQQQGRIIVAAASWHQPALWLVLQVLE
jgi:hypothetical protein